MNTYTRLIGIKYNNKYFDVFSGVDNRKEFLEIKDSKYCYPDPSDALGLSLIFNCNEDLLCSKRDKFDYALIACYVFLAANLAVSGINIGYYFLNRDKIIQDKIAYYEQNHLADEFITIKDNSELDNYGITKVTFTEVRETLKNNSSISNSYKKYIEEFIDRLEERLPNVDLRIFNYNLKTLVIDENESKLDIHSDGEYDKVNNIITLKPNYSTEKRKQEVIFHELGHTINNALITIIRDNNKIIKIHKCFSKSDIGFGKFGVEGFNTVLTDYLISDNWETYFNQESMTFNTYKEISICCFEFMKLFDYSFNEYLNSNIDDFVYFLDSYDIPNYSTNDIVNLLDSATSTHNDVEVTDITKIFILKETLVKMRLKRELASSYNEIEVLKRTCDAFPYSSYEAFKEISKGFDTNINCSIASKQSEIEYIKKADGTTEAVINNQYVTVNLYNDNYSISGLDANNVFIYKDNGEYKFCFKKRLVRDIYNLYDFRTNNMIDENITKYPLYDFLNKYFDLDYSTRHKKNSYTFSIDENIVNNPYLKEVLDENINQKSKIK